MDLLTGPLRIYNDPLFSSLQTQAKKVGHLLIVSINRTSYSKCPMTTSNQISENTDDCHGLIFSILPDFPKYKETSNKNENNVLPIFSPAKS